MSPNESSAQANIVFDNSYVRLAEQLYTAQQPTAVTNAALITVNSKLADILGIDSRWLTSDEGLAMLAGNAIPAGAEPIAAVYAGHQFGTWNPQLGDGRAVLLGETVTADGQRFDIQLKGAGPTPYSRGGDGRSPLGPVLREYIVSEAMAALGVATTRSLAAVSTGEMVYRDTALPGGILTRVASSHIRVGTFEYFASRQDTTSVELLCQHIIERHYPRAANASNPILALLTSAIDSQAKLVASWQAIGFIHGVMNTDNTLLCGETIDYGPCAFIDSYNPRQVFSSIDRQGRYAYQNQPGISHWNMAQFAKTLLPLLSDDKNKAIVLAQGVIDDYAAIFDRHNHSAFKKKLGLENDLSDDKQLIGDFLALLQEQNLDFTLSFRALADLVTAPLNNESALTKDGLTNGGLTKDDQKRHSIDALYKLPAEAKSWLERWRARLKKDPQSAITRQTMMDQANPVFIPRNHLIEQCINSAVQKADFSAFLKLNSVLSKPGNYQHDLSAYALPPEEGQGIHQTFCGT